MGNGGFSVDNAQSIWRNPNFALLWVGKLTSGFGDRVTHMAIIWWLLDTTGRTDLLGMVMLCATLAAVIVSPVGGVMADRKNRKSIIVWMDVARGVVLLGGVFLLHRGAFTVGWLLTGTALTAMFSSLFMPAATSLIPNLVRPDQLVQANSLLQLNLNLIGLVGPAVGGVLVAAVGVKWCLLITGAAYLMSAVSEAFIRVPPQTEIRESRSMGGDLKDAAAYVLSRPLLFSMCITFSVLNFFCAPVGSVLLPGALTGILAMGSVELGLTMAAIPAGVVAATLLLSIRPQAIGRHSTALVVGVAAIGGAVAGTGVLLAAYSRAPGNPMPSFLGLIGMCVALGVGSSLANVATSSFMQRTIPDERRGRTFGLLTTLTHGLMPLSMGLTALLLSRMSIPGLFMINGLFIAVGGLYLLLIPGFREI